MGNSDLYTIDPFKKEQRYSLFSLANWKNGLAFKNINFSESGKPIIKIAELNNGISENTARTNGRYDSNVSITKGDLLFAWSGNPETSIDVYRYKLEDGWLNQHIFKVTPDNNLVDENYFYYLLKYLKPTFKKIASNKQTTGLGHVTLADLKLITVCLHSLVTQRKIASILSALDNKIELNNQISENLEGQAKSLYEEHFQREQKGDTKTLDEFCDIFTGRKNANASVENGQYAFFTCAPEVLPINSFIYDGAAIIVSGNGAYTGRTRFYSGKFDLYQRTYACTLKEGVEKSYIYSLYWFVKFNLSKKIGGGTRGSAIPYIVMNDLAKFEFKFNSNQFDEYSPLFKEMVEKQMQIEKENKRLAELRDTLLPKLMTGEIDVDAIEL